MSRIGATLPQPAAVGEIQNYAFEAPADLLDRWAGASQFSAAEDNRVIDIFGEIGWEVTPSGIASRLRAAGRGPVSVRINSFGGSVFDGISIYNLLAQHDGFVTVDILGIAASAASVIAMAGDEIIMHLGTELMIHNAWGIAVGNRHDMRDVADILDRIDGEMVGIYQARSGIEADKLTAMLDDETFMSAQEAKDAGFPVSLTNQDPNEIAAKADVPTEVLARRRMEAALARGGLSRNARSDLLDQAGLGRAPRDASPSNEAERDAGASVEFLSGLLEIFKQ